MDAVNTIVDYCIAANLDRATKLQYHKNPSQAVLYSVILPFSACLVPNTALPKEINNQKLIAAGTVSNKKYFNNILNTTFRMILPQYSG